VTKENRIIIRNEYVRCSIGVASIVNKIRENRLRLLEHVIRREKIETGRVVMKIIVEG
jgi:hypothetical protein